MASAAVVPGVPAVEGEGMMSDDLRERIDRAIARVPAGKAADAVLDAIAETAVIVERGRFERLLEVAAEWEDMFPDSLQPGDLDPLP